MKSVSDKQIMRRIGLWCCGLLASLAFTASAQIPLATNEHSYAFWPMTGEPAGATFTDPNYSESATVHQPNLESAAIRAGVSYNLRTIRFRTYGDGYVVITDDIPGKYLFSNATDMIPMCDDYRSFRCVNYTSAYAAKSNPMAFISNICLEMRNRPAWTLEYFVKNIDAKGVLSYFDISGAGQPGDCRLTLEFPTSSMNPNRVRLTSKLPENSVTFDFPAGTDFSKDGKWHHIALAYCQTQEQIEKGEDGDLQLYVDYQRAPSTIKLRRDTSKTSGECRFRGAVGDGYVAAPRFTTKALTADELMRASDEMTQDDSNVVAYYPFDEQPQGVLLETYDSVNYTGTSKFYTNQIVSSSHANGKSAHLQTKAAEGKGGVVFVSTNVVPARYIYPNLAATLPLREPKTSLFIMDASSNSGLASSFIQFNGLSRVLNCELEDWTMEWFFKFEKDPGAVMMYCRLLSNPITQFGLGRNMNYGANRVRFTTSNPSDAQTVEYPDLPSLADGKWHHFAVVCKNDKLRLYCDYIRATPSDLTVVRDPSVTDVNETRFGQGNQRGMMSNLRVSGKALEPHEFMYASDSANGVLGTSGYLWTLDGTKGETVGSVPATMSTLPTDSNQYLFSDTKGLVGAVSGAGSATYDECVFGGRRIIDGTDRGRNASSASLSGAYVKGGSSAPLCQLGRVFTVEACVNATQAGAGAATVLGAETATGTSAWRLRLGSDGALKLEITLSTGAVVEKTVVESGFVGAARHLAVAADVMARRFNVYVDRALALTVDESSLYMPLVDGPTLVAGGGCGGLVMNGRIDEIRVSRAILAVDDFEQFVIPGLNIILR